jgi:hypothetical protein
MAHSREIKWQLRMFDHLDSASDITLERIKTLDSGANGHLFRVVK